MPLTKKQLIAIDDLFESGGDEASVLQKHKISLRDWRKWLTRRDFTDEIAARLESSKRQSNIILTKYLPFAATKLVQLCESENHQTALKATLDILSSQTGESEIRPGGQVSNSKSAQSEISNLKSQIPDTPPTIDQATASKLLSALADEKPA